MLLPPEGLRRLVWRSMDIRCKLAMFEALNHDTTTSDDDKDISAQGFLTTLLWFEEVILQVNPLTPKAYVCL